MMNCIGSRRKNYQVEMDREAYQRHIKKLEELYESKITERINKLPNKKKLTESFCTINKTQTPTKNTNLDKIKSVVIKEFYSPIPLIASKHKKNNSTLISENIKMFERITNVKSRFSSSKEFEANQNIKIAPCKSFPDFTETYSKSTINQNNPKILKIKLHKNKNYLKAELIFNWKEILPEINGKSSNYSIELRTGEKVSRSGIFILEEICLYKIYAKLPPEFEPSNLVARLVEVINTHYQQQKEIIKKVFHVQSFNHNSANSSYNNTVKSSETTNTNPNISFNTNNSNNRTLKDKSSSNLLSQNIIMFEEIKKEAQQRVRHSKTSNNKHANNKENE